MTDAPESLCNGLDGPRYTFYRSARFTRSRCFSGPPRTGHGARTQESFMTAGSIMTSVDRIYSSTEESLLMESRCELLKAKTYRTV